MSPPPENSIFPFFLSRSALFALNNPFGKSNSTFPFKISLSSSVNSNLSELTFRFSPSFVVPIIGL